MMNESDFEYFAGEPATELQRLGPSDDDWWRELQAEIDAESTTSDTTTGLCESEICWRAADEQISFVWRAADEQISFARNLSPLPAESNGHTPDLRRLLE